MSYKSKVNYWISQYEDEDLSLELLKGMRDIVLKTLSHLSSTDTIGFTNSQGDIFLELRNDVAARHTAILYWIEELSWKELEA